MFVSRGKILARRDWEAKISLNNVVISSYWMKSDIPEEGTAGENEAS